MQHGKKVSSSEDFAVTAIGTAGSFPQLGRGGSTYLVEASDGQRDQPFRLLVDCGAPDEIDLYCDPASIDAIYVSHMHPDHMNIAPLVVRHFYHPDGPFLSPFKGTENRIPQIDLYGPKGIEEELARKVNSEYGKALADPEELRKIFRFHTVTEGEFELGPFQARTALTIHPEETYALRLEHPGGATFCYSSDGAADPESGLTESVVELAKDADLLLCNAPAATPVHQSSRQAGASAKEAGAKNLVLSHFTPAWAVPDWAQGGRTVEAAETAWRAVEQRACLEAMQEFGPRVSAAQPGQQWDVAALHHNSNSARRALRRTLQTPQRHLPPHTPVTSSATLR